MGFQDLTFDLKLNRQLIDHKMAGSGDIRLVRSTHRHLLSAPHTERSPHGHQFLLVSPEDSMSAAQCQKPAPLVRTIKTSARLESLPGVKLTCLIT